jgi:hypothetical protein
LSEEAFSVPAGKPAVFCAGTRGLRDAGTRDAGEKPSPPLRVSLSVSPAPCLRVSLFIPVEKTEGNIMSKNMDTKKDGKKKPAKSLKEKRAENKGKKETKK